MKNKNILIFKIKIKFSLILFFNIKSKLNFLISIYTKCKTKSITSLNDTLKLSKNQESVTHISGFIMSK